MTTTKQAVRETYGAIGKDGGSCCAPSCCDGAATTPSAEQLSGAIGYSAVEMSSVPAGANLGLGCGNPQAIAALEPGETVLDLGSGGGFDAFLAADKVGETGRVIGVDMTPEMITRARANAGDDYANVGFRLGEIEALPVADNAVDVIISNCVINLSPDKPAVFAEAFRVLKPGGRLAISDVVAADEIPDDVRGDRALWVGCVAGAESVSTLKSMLADAGFADVRIAPKGAFISEYVHSATIEAVKR